MLAHSDNRWSAGYRHWTRTGVGSAYGPRPYADNLGYGWERIRDRDVFAWLGISAFHSKALQMTRPVKDHDNIKYPLSWR